jgi:hypothetical protein
MHPLLPLERCTPTWNNFPIRHCSLVRKQRGKSRREQPRPRAAQRAGRAGRAGPGRPPLPRPLGRPSRVAVLRGTYHCAVVARESRDAVEHFLPRFLGFGGQFDFCLAPRPPRSKASRIAASRTDSDSALVAMPNSSRAIRSAASSSRWRALALTCGALAPCQSHTVVPRRACRRHCSPFFLCAMHLRAGLPRWRAVGRSGTRRCRNSA